MRSILRAALFLFSTSAAAQRGPTDDSATALDAARISTDQTGLKILVGWGALNLTTGLAGAFAADGEGARRFHQMNAGWGGVNLALAGFGLARARRDLDKQRTAEDAFKQYRRDRRVFAINTGLDVVYAGIGAYLVHRGDATDAKNPAQLRGFGKSLILQGAALFLFDAAMWATHGANKKALQRVIDRVELSADGVGMRVPL